MLVLLSAGLSASLSAAPLSTNGGSEGVRRVDRAKVRETIAKLRAVPHGEGLVAGTHTDSMNGVEIGRLELRDGTEVLVHNAWRSRAIEKVTIHGRIGSGDDALFYLNAKERQEVRRFLRGALAGYGYYNPRREVSFNKVDRDLVTTSLAKLFASSSPTDLSGRPRMAASAEKATSNTTNPRSLVRQDRAKVRELIAKLRAVPHQQAIDLNNDFYRRITLPSGPEVLVFVPRPSVGGYFINGPLGNLHVYGRITTTGDDPLVLLNAKERRAALQVITQETLRGTVRPPDIVVDQVESSVSKDAFAQAFASTSPAARNYLVLKQMRVHGI